jgi:predicted dienelactone hydrolase
MKNSDSPVGEAPQAAFKLSSLPQDRGRRAALRMGLAAGLGAMGASISSAQELPGAQAQVWVDGVRAREIPVLLRWPAGRPVGVMVYSHGLGGKKEGADVWGKAWASAGILAVHLQHLGSDAASLKGGFSALRKAMQPEQLAARIQDVSFVIAEMARRRTAGEANWAGLPVDRLAVGGHSFGARSTLALAGWQRAGYSKPDLVPKAFLAMSPAVGAGVGLEQARKELAAVTRPMLLCTGSLDGEVLNNGETPEARRMVYDALPPGKKALLWLDQADHFTFAGNDKQIPSSFLARRNKVTLELEEAHHERVARLSTAWLKEQLLGQSMPAVTGLASGDQWLRG